MFWSIAAVVVLLLFGLAWWTSGRARRPLPPGRPFSTTEADHLARSAGSRASGSIFPF